MKFLQNLIVTCGVLYAMIMAFLILGHQWHIYAGDEPERAAWIATRLSDAGSFLTPHNLNAGGVIAFGIIVLAGAAVFAFLTLYWLAAIPQAASLPDLMVTVIVTSASGGGAYILLRMGAGILGLI